MKSRHMGMMLGGIAAAVVGGRLVPPLAAGLLGWQRARAGGDPFALLIEDHRKILQILNRMSAAAGHSTLKRARLFMMLKRKLAKHAMAEEDVVYPMVRNDSASGERKHLYDEHADMKILLHEVEEQVKAGEDWTATVAALRSLIRNHAEEEEKTIFPELRRQVARERQPKLAGQISREEAVVI